MQPPQNLGIAPKSHEAALFAISQSAMHWSIAQYCIYAICGVAFALMAFNEHLPLSIISGLDLVMPRKHYSLAKKPLCTPRACSPSVVPSSAASAR